MATAGRPNLNSQPNPPAPHGSASAGRSSAGGQGRGGMPTKGFRGGVASGHGSTSMASNMSVRPPMSPHAAAGLRGAGDVDNGRETAEDRRETPERPGEKPDAEDRREARQEGSDVAAKPNSRAPLGSGGRFAALKQKVAAQGAHDPGALAAYIGRKKYGKARFGKLSAGGKK